MAVIDAWLPSSTDLGLLTPDVIYGGGCSSALARAVSNCNHEHISVQTVVAKLCGRNCRITV